MNLDFFNFFKQTLNEDKLSHAFLIETSNINEFTDDFLDLLYKENLIKQKDIGSNLIIISPDGRNIKVNQISDLQEKFSTYPVNYKYNFYIIKNADLLNKSSANKLLKFLEEPDAPNIGILVTSSLVDVIDTIKSRSQIFKVIYEEEILDIDIDLLDIKDYKDVLKIKQSLKLNEREELIKKFEKLILYYDKMIDREGNYNNIKIFAKLIENLEKSIHLLKYNVNIDLVLDKLFIELRR